MKKILFLLVCIISSVFTACNDDDGIVNCAAQYPFETNLFISLETGDMIRFAPESSQLYNIRYLISFLMRAKKI